MMIGVFIASITCVSVGVLFPAFGSHEPLEFQRFFPAFAALIALAPSRASHMDTYKKWIQRVGVNEYADELIVAAVASELGVRIACVPYPPADARSPAARAERPR